MFEVLFSIFFVVGDIGEVVDLVGIVFFLIIFHH
jgi:hypothetical protein